MEIITNMERKLKRIPDDDNLSGNVLVESICIISSLKIWIQITNLDLQRKSHYKHMQRHAFLLTYLHTCTHTLTLSCHFNQILLDFIKSSLSFHFTAASIRGLLFILLSRTGSLWNPTEMERNGCMCVRLYSCSHINTCCVCVFACVNSLV